MIGPGSDKKNIVPSTASLKILFLSLYAFFSNELVGALIHINRDVCKYSKCWAMALPYIIPQSPASYWPGILVNLFYSTVTIFIIIQLPPLERSPSGRSFSQGQRTSVNIPKTQSTSKLNYCGRCSLLKYLKIELVSTWHPQSFRIKIQIRDEGSTAL